MITPNNDIGCWHEFFNYTESTKVNVQDSEMENKYQTFNIYYKYRVENPIVMVGS